MWTEQDDYDEETDIMIMMALEDLEDKKKSNSSSASGSGSCLIFALTLAGFGTLPWLLLLGKLLS